MADLVINFKTVGDQVVIGALRQIGGGLLDLAGGAISGAASAFGDLASEMVSGNAEFERYTTQFGVLLGGADAAKERLAQLAEFGAKTPFELPEIVRADKILQAFGLHAEDTAERFGFSGEEIRTIAGDVAAGTGSSFEEISTYLGKFASGATGEAISRMQELGIVTREQLAGMGLEFSKSGELLTPVNDAMDVVLAAMQDKFGGMMDAQSGTFEGMMSNFEDFKAGLIRTVGAPIFEVAKEGLGKLLEFLNGPEAQAAITGFASSMADIVGAVMAFIEIAAGGDVGGAFDALGEFDSVRAIFKALGIDIYEVGGVVEDFVEFVVASWPSVWQAIQDGWAAMQPVFQGIGDFLINVVVPAFQQAVAWVITNWPAIQQAIMDGWAAAQPVLQAVWDFIQTVVIPAFQSAVAWVVDNWPTIQATIAEVMAQVQAVVEDILSGIQAFWDEWGDDILQIVDYVTTQVQNVFDIFSAAFSGDWKKFGEELRDYFDTAWAEIILIVSKAIDWFLEQDWGKIGSDIISGIANGITSATQFIVDAAVAAARAAFDAAKGFLGIQSPSKLFAGLGENMMLGMANGITSNAALPAYASAGAAYAATVSVGNIIIDGAQSPVATGYAVQDAISQMARDGYARARMR